MTEVVAALIRAGDKFMICQRPAHKARGLLWEFVGGKVEPGETQKQALIRECREELAVTLSVGDVFMDVIHEYPDITVHLTLFNAAIADGIPQKKRIIAFLDESGRTPVYTVMLNPEIIKKDDAYDTEEGCLSLLGDPRKCKRYKTIKVQYQTVNMQTRVKTYTGWTAQIIQHEVDHCNGVLI